MDYKDLLQTHYFQEFERKRELNGNLSIVVGVITIIAAGVASMLKDIHPPWSALEWFLLVGLVLTAITIAVAIYFAVRAFVGHAYRYVAPMASIVNWRSNARARGFDGAELDDATVSVFVDQYAEAISTNDLVNDTKSGYVHRASQATVAALVFAVVSAVPWSTLEVLNASKTADVGKISKNDTGQRQTAPASTGKGAAGTAAKPTDQRERNSSGAAGS